MIWQRINPILIKAKIFLHFVPGCKPEQSTLEVMRQLLSRGLLEKLTKVWLVN